MENVNFPTKKNNHGNLWVILERRSLAESRNTRSNETLQTWKINVLMNRPTTSWKYFICSEMFWHKMKENSFSVTFRATLSFVYDTRWFQSGKYLDRLKSLFETCNDSVCRRKTKILSSGPSNHNCWNGALMNLLFRTSHASRQTSVEHMRTVAHCNRLNIFLLQSLFHHISCFSSAGNFRHYFVEIFFTLA